jgi:hypothetical protein
MYCMLAFDKCLFSVKLASFTSHQCNSHSISSFFSPRTPSAPSVSPSAITTHARVSFTHDPSPFRYHYTLLLINQPASLTQSCSHSSCASAIQHPSPAPPLLPTINSMPSELSQPSQPAQCHPTPAPASFSCFHHISILFWFVYKPPDHHTRPYTSRYDCMQGVYHA